MGVNMYLIDLTKPIFNNMEVYPGDPHVIFEKWCDIDDVGYRVTKICFGTHTGTHIDAPSHMIRDGPSIDSLEINRFIGRALLINIDKKVVDIGDIKAFDELFQNDTILLIKTKKNGFLTIDAANYIVSKRVKLVIFHENCIIDSEGEEDYPVHKTFLSNDIPIVSNAINLERVENGDLVIVAPLKLIGVDGAACRVFVLKK